MYVTSIIPEKQRPGVDLNSMPMPRPGFVGTLVTKKVIHYNEINHEIISEKTYTYWR